MLLDILFISVGIFLLIKGADWLVEGGSSLARHIGITDLVIGLTIVSFGTSAPELIVNIVASFRDSADIAIGNIVGSNIANTLLILGATAAITPLVVRESTVYREIPFCLLASVTLMVMTNDAIVDGYAFSELSRSDGFAFLGFFIIFLYYTFGIRHNHADAKKKKIDRTQQSLWLPVTLMCAGCIGLGAGGHFTVEGARSITLSAGISEALVGLTIVAIGTSLPELVTSVTAALKGNADIAVGNVIGSNIFNIFWILGLSATIKPLTFQPAINTDLFIVILSILALFLFVHIAHVRDHTSFWKRRNQGHMIFRYEGITLLTSYCAYIGYIVWRG